MSYLLRGVAAAGGVRVIAADTTELVEYARVRHGMAPTATAALGRTLTGALLLSHVLLKNPQDRVTLRLRGDGPLGGVIADAGLDGAVRGYATNPDADLPPRPDGKLDVGGALGNTASALHALGIRANYAANVGDDLFGRWLYDELKAHGCTLTVTPGPTALTVALSHPNGERTFITHEGHFRAFEVGRLESQIAALRPNDLFLVCGHLLVPALRAHALSLCQKARAKGATVLLDTGWPPKGWTEEVRRELNDLLENCDYFLPNREELAGLTGEADVENGLKRLPADLQTVVKLGDGGAGMLEAGTYINLPAPSVTVADTVGAGDTFNAAFVYGLREKLPLQQAVKIAVQAASWAVSSRPRRYPTLTDLNASL